MSRQIDLQDTALELISKYGLINILSRFGETHLVGNVALGTTVKPDIDIQIYSDPTSWEKNAAQIINSFAKLGLDDFVQRDLKESGKYLISFATVIDGTRWTIDITQTVPSEDYLKDAYTFLLEYKDRLTTTNTRTIRSLKKYFLNRRMLHNSMSYYIYRAVLDYNIKNTKEMFGYLKDNNINIGRFKR